MYVYIVSDVFFGMRVPLPPRWRRLTLLVTGWGIHCAAFANGEADAAQREPEIPADEALVRTAVLIAG